MTAELKAGFFVLAAISTLVYMTTRLTQNQFSFNGTKSYYANIADATGLLSKTKVKMAGLDVGQLSKIELAGKRARITVEIAADMKLAKDSTIAVKAIGFLGDKYLELLPGNDAKGILEEGGYIVEGAASGSIDQLTAKTSLLVDNLKEITDILRDAMKGAGNAEDEGTRLDHILDNMEQFSEGLAGLDKLGDLADRLNEVASNVRGITTKVERGEGTLGKLLTDSETIDRLNDTLSGVQKLVNKADKLQFLIDGGSGYLTAQKGSLTHFNLMIQPTYDKYYLIGATVRPQGITTTKTTVTTTSPGTTSASATTVETKENNESGFGLNLQFAKRFADFFFRIGLFETTGGAAVDYMLFDDKAKVSAEVYRFQKSSAPQVNLGAQYSLYRPFYVHVGGDYLFNKENRSFFLGAGVRFTDDDIKSLFTAAMAGAR